ncbi:hypothetical protein ACSXAY_10300 [Clostridium perfringens]
MLRKSDVRKTTLQLVQPLTLTGTPEVGMKFGTSDVVSTSVITKDVP